MWHPVLIDQLRCAADDVNMRDPSLLGFQVQLT